MQFQAKSPEPDNLSIAYIRNKNPDVADKPHDAFVQMQWSD